MLAAESLSCCARCAAVQLGHGGRVPQPDRAEPGQQHAVGDAGERVGQRPGRPARPAAAGLARQPPHRPAAPRMGLRLAGACLAPVSACSDHISVCPGAAAQPAQRRATVLTLAIPMLACFLVSCQGDTCPPPPLCWLRCDAELCHT